MPVASNPLQPARPPAAAPPLSYLVGQDGEGHWVALEAGGRAGGIFRTRRDAIRYACDESGCRPDDVRLTADPIPFRLT
ncbi:RAG2 PHD domain containing protein [Methylobacterium sp. J-070]|uniref:RAG2 PHD domain containing protein n=1 Tax=Methylobacterium sp. J-070 TaxID=2836650 RepID=UPI001FB9246A|nr:RAG2 PHD domain containing protein [Methylobacterium sp. J-070]MCJ2048833.1 RAG2 PHD domain containing protein [Methylobacterium sp. J-070]